MLRVIYYEDNGDKGDVREEGVEDEDEGGIGDLVFGVNLLLNIEYLRLDTKGGKRLFRDDRIFLKFSFNMSTLVIYVWLN